MTVVRLPALNQSSELLRQATLPLPSLLLYQHQQHVEQRLLTIDVSSAVQKRSGSREAFSVMHAPRPHHAHVCMQRLPLLGLPAVLAAGTSSHELLQCPVLSRQGT